MMTRIGYEEVDIEALKKPDNWAEYLASDEARELAGSIKTHGLINDVTVRRSDMKLLAGRTRAAARRSGRWSCRRCS